MIRLKGVSSTVKAVLYPIFGEVQFVIASRHEVSDPLFWGYCVVGIALIALGCINLHRAIEQGVTK